MPATSDLGGALAVQPILEELGLPFCFIGGLVVGRWGEPRFTRDANVTLFCPIGDEAEVIPKLAERLPGRVESAVEFAQLHRIYLAKSPAGTPVDIALGTLDFEYRCVNRATDFMIGLDQRLRTCSAEDLIVLKAFAGRPRDWLDIEGVILSRGPKLNWPQILEELNPLAALKEAPELVEGLVSLRDKLG
ncbi:MAG: hypothetical protein JNM76_06830 [Betaproteobacteria bacterium]|nr:hypothetical protein [Betaproteobacteria bacterium]